MQGVPGPKVSNTEKHEKNLNFEQENISHFDPNLPISLFPAG